MIKGSRQLMDLIKKRVGSESGKVQTTLRLYAMERFLARLARSPWHSCFIIKGGALVVALVGVDMRSTMDIDATITGIDLSAETINSVIRDICGIDADDGMTFIFKGTEDIMEGHAYSGIRVAMEARIDRTRIPMKLDFSTGDAVTPQAVEFGYPLLLEPGTIKVNAYNLETLLAEKLETALSLGTVNTRMRDFYDMHVLLEHYRDRIRPAILIEAFRATCESRATGIVAQQGPEIIDEIRMSAHMSGQWDRYRSRFSYAAHITWHDATQSAKVLLNAIASCRMP